MITDMRTANAVGGKTARACDSCLNKRARWYCAADDAFLCKSCDASVHSANQLASRHERVRLGTASSKTTESDSPPAWHHGFTRKARTPRQRKEKEDNITNTFPLVPEIGNDEGWVDEDEEQLLYRVPIFDPFAAELCNVSNEIKKNQPSKDEEPFVMFNDSENVIEGCDMDGNYNNSNLHGFAPSDMELAEFAADVESLLGRGFDEDSCGIQGLGLIDCKEEEEDCVDVCFEGNNRVKVEEEEVELAMKGCHMECGMDVTRETIDWNFDYESPAIGEEDAHEMVAEAQTSVTINIENKEQVRRKILLRLNYDEVIAAWDNQGSPWTTGTRPEFNPDDCFSDFMGMWPGDIHNQYGNVGGRVDGGREARVSRYREKRRTRLFSKKIRYEVRKLNAEKRPRMKGRFVKRTSFAGAAPGCHPYLINK